MFELDFEHADPGAFGCQVIRKRIVGEWPCVPFAPKAIHERVDVFDERIAVEFRSQKTDKFLECLLKKRMVVAGLIARMRVVQKSFSRGLAFLIARLEQIDLRYFFKDKIGESRFALVVRSAH